MIRIGRFAGQYAKPRSAHLETRGGVSLPPHRGDNINRSEFSAGRPPARPATPATRLRARFHDAQLRPRAGAREASPTCTIPSTSTSTGSGTRRSRTSTIAWCRPSRTRCSSSRTCSECARAIPIRSTFTAHEALHLGYESAQTRRVPRRPGYFNLLTHFPWVGLRTNDPESAHLEYLRGIENPVGIKIGGGCTRERVARWLDMLDPDRRPGRLTFIHRFGAGKIADSLPR